MSQALMSASETGLPSPGLSASTGPAPSESARASAESGLCIDMLDLPFAVDRPAGDAVVVLVGESQRGRHRLAGLAPRRHEFGAQRLGVAAVVPGAALQDRGLALPAPGHDEAGERLGIDGPLQRGFCPRL